jgi:hypothetical protein
MILARMRHSGQQVLVPPPSQRLWFVTRTSSAASRASALGDESLFFQNQLYFPHCVL